MGRHVLRPAWSLGVVSLALLLLPVAAPAPGQPRDAAVTAGPSSASSASGEAERRGRQALGSLRYPWRDLGYSIEFREHRGVRLGSANSRTKHIVIYVRRDQSQQSLRVTIAHELGHALDFEHATAARRDEYRVVRRIDRSAAWYPCDACSDYRSHAGDWSEVFAYWLAGPGDFRSQVAGPPSAEQLRRLGPLFAVPRPQPPPPGTSPPPSASPRPSPRPSPLPALPLPHASPLPPPPGGSAAGSPADLCLPEPAGLPGDVLPSGRPGLGVPHVPGPAPCPPGVR